MSAKKDKSIRNEPTKDESSNGFHSLLTLYKCESSIFAIIMSDHNKQMPDSDKAVNLFQFCNKLRKFSDLINKYFKIKQLYLRSLK